MNFCTPSKNQNGLTIIELVIASFIAGIIGMVVISMLQLMTNFAKQLNIQIVREESQRAIIRAVKSNKSIAQMCSHNPEFAECFDPGNPNCVSGEVLPMNIYDASGMRIAGTATDPVYVDANGSPCILGTNRCVFRMEATFRPQGFPEDCSGCRALLPRAQPRSDRLHELITIQYQIVPIASSTGGIMMSSSEGSVTFALDQVFVNGCPPL